MRVIVTGGAGFIGSALVRHLVRERGCEVLNVDKLTYAGNLASLREVEGAPNYRFCKADICDRAAMEQAVPGDVIMLSPACASFDQFRDFEARGDCFRQIVAALTEGN